MRNFLVTGVLAAFLVAAAAVAAPGGAGAGKVPVDPLGLDPGPEKDEAAFLAWAADPKAAPEHPLSKLATVVQRDPRNWADYLKFLCRQAGIKGKAAVDATKKLAEIVYLCDPYINSPAATREEQAKEAKYRKEMAKRGRLFFKLVSRKARARVYVIGEKFELAARARRDLVLTAKSEITDDWIDEERALEDRNEAGYFYGMFRDRTPATVRAITEDFKKTVTFMVTFAGPPSYMSKKEKEKFRRKKRAERAKLLDSLEPIEF